MVDKDANEPGSETGRQELDSKLIVGLERAGHALRTELRVRARDAGITLTQAEILLRLCSDRLDQRRVGSIAQEFDVRQPTVSDAVSALERKGLLKRCATPGDARSADLVPTAAGQETAAKLAPWERAAREVLAERTESEKEVALGLLVELIAGLNRAGSIQIARACPTCRYFETDGAAPRCALLQMTLAPADLRVDCPEHEPAGSSA